MKIAKFSSKNAGDALAQAGGVAAGMLLSNGASAAIPLSNSMARKGIVLVAGLAAVALVNGTDTGAKAVRAMGVGIAAQQAKELIKEVASPHIPNVKFLNDAFEKTTPTPATEGVAASLAARRRNARLGNPMFKMGTAQVPVAHGTLIAG